MSDNKSLSLILGVIGYGWYVNTKKQVSIVACVTLKECKLEFVKFNSK